MVFEQLIEIVLLALVFVAVVFTGPSVIFEAEPAVTVQAF
ncbi:hypothetical protein CIP106467_2883 [Citrobacter europaeus]|uniref:Uncharacterized protein n=1 Tax=Citrobacter freundii TaxID=546 RepID=A0A7G2IXD4_CITFR|nr:putative membrane protein [Citrobacter freundii]CAD7562779.1 hypothetical protein CIP106467_2883 [Citrobacter europaeus]CDL41838.1 hypothetical protein [Citrobacter freundii]